MQGDRDVARKLVMSTIKEPEPYMLVSGISLVVLSLILASNSDSILIPVALCVFGSILAALGMRGGR